MLKISRKRSVVILQKYKVVVVSILLLLVLCFTLKSYKVSTKNQPSLVNENASRETVELFDFLNSQKGKVIISGQQDINEANWIYENTGKYPVIVGFDFYDYTGSKKALGWESKQIEQAIKWYDKGGIVTFSWHWLAPQDKDGTFSNWKNGFYTESTDFDIEQTLNNTDSEGYKILIKDIDSIAVELEKLQKKNIPVLFRSLHEAEGGWFWWGAKGPESTKKLYRLMYNRLVNHHKLNNLIWVWNSLDPKWYPGDDYVDIISYDSYPSEIDHGTQSIKFNLAKSLGKGKKLVAMSENGPIPNPDLLKSNKVSWSWFMTWREEFIRSEDYNRIDYLKYVYSHKYVLTLDEYKELKGSE